jgi:hypothetical protein
VPRSPGRLGEPPLPLLIVGHLRCIAQGGVFTGITSDRRWFHRNSHWHKVKLSSFAVAAFHIRTSCFAALLLNRQRVNCEIAEIIINRSGRLAQW